MKSILAAAGFEPEPRRTRQLQTPFQAMGRGVWALLIALVMVQPASAERTPGALSVASAPQGMLAVHSHHADWLLRQGQQQCWLRPEVVQSIAQAQTALEVHGLALRLEACWSQTAKGHGDGRSVDVALWVVDTERAAGVLHGPLADDEAVDMGTTHAQTDPAEGAVFDSVSPDAKRHRAWLREMLAQQGLSVGNAWWHFYVSGDSTATHSVEIKQQMRPVGTAAAPSTAKEVLEGCGYVGSAPPGRV